MQEKDLFFVIPTYRLREVGETVEHYDEHFWRNGHSVRMIVFDDSSPANQEKYYPLLEQTKTHNDLYYVGPREKEQFLAYLNQRLARQAAGGAGQEPVPPQLRRQPQLHAHVHARRPDGQRRRRHAAVHADGAQPRVARLRRGLPRPAAQGWGRTATAASRSTSSRPSSTCWASPSARCRTTTSAASCWWTPRWTWRPTPRKGLARENSLLLQRGPLPDDAVVKMAQTFRSGTNDIDAIDYVEMFLGDERADGRRRPQRRLRAGELPPRGDEEELAHGLRRRGLRQHLRAAAVLPDAAALRGLHLPAVGAAGRRRRRARRCRAEPHQEQLHAQPAGRRRSSTRRSPTCSSGRSKARSRASTS